MSYHIDINRARTDGCRVVFKGDVQERQVATEHTEGTAAALRSAVGELRRRYGDVAGGDNHRTIRVAHDESSCLDRSSVDLESSAGVPGHCEHRDIEKSIAGDDNCAVGIKGRAGNCDNRII